MPSEEELTSVPATRLPRATKQTLALGEALAKLGAELPKLVVLCPDVSRTTGAVRFREAYPDRFICTGISEQNTMGMASGLAADGWLPVVAGQAVFVAGKAWEPLRNSIAYPRLNVKVVGTHAGINVGPDGVTHQATEDIALMRAMPGMTVLAPTDPPQVEPVLRAALRHAGPVYIRLERAPIPFLTDGDRTFRIGSSLQLRAGGDAAIIAIGGLVPLALEAAETLAGEGVEARVVSMVSIKPLDEAAVLRAARETGAIVAAEDHNCCGGLGGAIAELLARVEPVPMEQVAVRDSFAESGSCDELRRKYHLGVGDIAQAARVAVSRRGRQRASH
jgi:transketolase